MLHAHLPFVRHPEWNDPLEELWLHEAVSECYLPLLRVIDGWRRDGIPYRLTLSLSPTLLAMLCDPLLMQRCRHHLERLVELARREVERTLLQPEFQPVARHYLDRFRMNLKDFTMRWDEDLVGAFQRLAEEEGLELITCPATHPFLPLMMHQPEMVKAQVAVGRGEFTRLFGHSPRGLWLPECGWAPGLDTLLTAEGVGHTFLDAHALLGAWPPSPHVHAPVRTPAGLTIFGRDPETSRQVWNAQTGYPGDPLYREFYRDIGHDLDHEHVGPMMRGGVRLDTGIKYHRVTGPVGLASKEPYDPAAAELRALMHGDDFVAHRVGQAGRMADVLDRPALIVSPYDAELFGHWWYEGPVFLDRVMRRMCEPGSRVIPLTPREYLERHEVMMEAEPPFSSWGEGGYAEVWLNESTDWIYPLLDRVGMRLVDQARRHRGPGEVRTRRALDQALRELMLAQASDWPFMIRMGGTAQYGRRRVEEHVAAAEQLVQSVEEGQVDERTLSGLELRNNPFPLLSFESLF